MIGEPRAELTLNWLHLMPHLFIFQHDYRWTEYSFAYYLPPPPILAQSEWTQWRKTNSVTFNQERTLFRTMSWINTCISYFQNKTSAPSPSNRLRQCVYFLNQLGKRRARGGGCCQTLLGNFCRGADIIFSIPSPWHALRGFVAAIPGSRTWGYSTHYWWRFTMR